MTNFKQIQKGMLRQCEEQQASLPLLTLYSGTHLRSVLLTAAQSGCCYSEGEDSMSRKVDVESCQILCQVAVSLSNLGTKPAPGSVLFSRQ